MGIVVRSIRAVLFLPFRLIQSIHEGISAIARESFVFFHVCIFRTLQGREIQQVSALIKNLEKGTPADLIPAIQSLLAAPLPSSPHCRFEEAQNHLSAALKTHRASFFLLTQGVSQNFSLQLHLQQLLAVHQKREAFMKVEEKMEVDLFSDLVITEEDKSCIQQLLNLLAEPDKQKKAVAAFPLEQHLATLHPLRFLETIFTSPDLRKQLVAIRAIPDRWEGNPWMSLGFINKRAEQLENSHRQKSLLNYLSGFAQSLHIEESLLKPLVEKKEWKQLIETLVATLCSS